jgi:hypothetical protein
METLRKGVDLDTIVSSGHCSTSRSHVKGRPGVKYHVPIDLGAIGPGYVRGD